VAPPAGLEGSTGLTLQALAGGLPDDLPRHLRTLRRDLAALEDVGFPLVTEHVNGQTRWKLLDGFRRLPALGFAPSELMALVFTRDLLRPLQGTHIHAALDSALTKASAALPPPGLDFVRQMREFLSVRFGPHKTYRAHREVVDRTTRAIADRRTVQMRYFSASSGKTGRREVDPYHLWYAEAPRRGLRPTQRGRRFPRRERRGSVEARALACRRRSTARVSAAGTPRLH